MDGIPASVPSLEPVPFLLEDPAMQDIITMITTVGFPIVACFLFKPVNRKNGNSDSDTAGDGICIDAPDKGMHDRPVFDRFVDEGPIPVLPALPERPHEP